MRKNELLWLGSKNLPSLAKAAVYITVWTKDMNYDDFPCLKVNGLQEQTKAIWNEEMKECEIVWQTLRSVWSASQIEQPRQQLENLS